MILDLVNLDMEKLKLQIMIVFVCWLIVFISVAIDFVYAVKKSKSRGQPYIHSYGIRKSGIKLSQYFAVMFFMLFIDIINPFWIYSNLQPMPIFTIIGCAVWVWTEHKSVMEKFEDKVKFDENARDLLDTAKTLRKEIKSALNDVAEIKETSERLKKENKYE